MGFFISISGTYLGEFIDGALPSEAGAIEVTTPPPSADYSYQAGAWVAPTPTPITATQVKTEAGRRIVSLIPEWKQRNLTARAAQLAEKGRSNWSAAELAAWNAGEALWVQIAAIRDASDTLEATTSIPLNYTDDVHWP